ncbi:MAG: hypothetical protein HY842_01345 [Bacteroidetes bacterium]|nr:hypothetical protein [Bacteroidota bacterium]
MKKIFLLIAGLILLSSLSWGQELIPGGKKGVIKAGEDRYLKIVILKQYSEKEASAKFIAVPDKTEATIFFYSISDDWGILILQDFKSKKCVVFNETKGDRFIMVKTLADYNAFYPKHDASYEDNRIEFRNSFLYYYPTDGTVDRWQGPRKEPFIDKFYFIEEVQ